MTLHKAIEAARGLTAHRPPSRWPFGAHKNWDELKISLSTLPAKPMSEDEIITVICNKTGDDRFNPELKKIIRALRDAGVLYMEEKR